MFSNRARTFRPIIILILKASGVKVIGVDVSEDAVKQAIENKVIDLGLIRNITIEEQIQKLNKWVWG